MSAQKLLLLVVASVIAIGSSWYYFESPKDGQVSLHETVKENTVENSEGLDTAGSINSNISGNGSFAYLSSLGQNLQCDISVFETGVAVSGEVYIAGESLRADMEMGQGGAVYSSHLIKQQNTLYSWSITPYGDYALQSEITNGNGESKNDASFEEPVEYNCSPWEVDEEMFVLPEGVEFKTMEEMVPEVQ